MPAETDPPGAVGGTGDATGGGAPGGGAPGGGAPGGGAPGAGATGGPPRHGARGGSISLSAADKLRGRENYSTWAFATKMLMIREGTWDAVTRQGLDPEDDHSLQGLATICLQIEPMLFSLVQTAKTAKQAWTNLQNAFRDDGMTRRIGLLRKLTSIRLTECASVEEYVHELMSTSHKLTEVGFTVDDTWLACLLLMGLPETYEPMIMGLEASGTRITADAVKAKILQDVKISSESSRSSNEEAFYSKKKTSGGKKKTDKSKIQCYRCKQFGHFASECEQEGSNESKDKKEQSGRRNAAMTTFENPSKRESDWFFDSGATSHMCSSKTLLQKMQEASQCVTVANDAELSVVATGNVELEADIGGESCDLTMSEVLCVPEIAINLLSVSRMCSKGHSVLFTKEACEVRSSCGELVAVGQETNGLYKLCLTSKQVSCAAQSKGDIILWHRRMGHLNEQSLRKLRSLAEGVDFGNGKIPTCVTCLEGKQFRKPFNTEGTRATEVLELVHSDLCGPMEEESIGGSKYFLSLIDDASRKLVVYFLKSKTEVLECFQEYKALMENQTGKTIKALRTDNGTEYVNKEMKRFLRSCGIRHETTVPCNPEQNGLAERMNRTVVEKARCLMLDAGLDKSFWAEATAMATFLINRSPTKGVPVTPEERFTGKRPDLSELKVFGAKVMCHVPKQRRRKWDAKSEPGIFVGFAYQSKGYRVYLPRTKTVKIVRDAVFVSEEKQCSAEVPEEKIPESRRMKNEVIISDGQSADEVGPPADVPDHLSEAGSDCSYPEDVAEGDTDDGNGPLYVSASEVLESSVAESVALPSQSLDPLGIRRSERERKYPGKYKDYDMTYSVIPKKFSVSQKPSTNVRAGKPQSFRESKERQLWQRAIEDEFEALMSIDTWEQTGLPPECKAMKCWECGSPEKMALLRWMKNHMLKTVLKIS